MLASFRSIVLGAPSWVGGALALAAFEIVFLAAHHALWWQLGRLTARRGRLLSPLVHRTRGPTRLATALLVASVLIDADALPGLPRLILTQPLEVGSIVLTGWAALAALHGAALIYTRRFKVESDDNLIARRHVTQVSILEKTAAVFIILVTAGAALMTLPAVRQYGVSLLASAGAAGIIAGLALQPLLTNLIAGVQIALTQPIRIDDAVVVNGEWGRIEEIGVAFVTVRIWDWRRMILPLSYFIQQPFQNWTRQSASLIGVVMFYVDYSAPLDAMRNKLAEIARGSPLWDHGVVNLQVTDLTERTMQVRCLVSARNSNEAFDLRCEVREQMIAFLREAHPYALPQDRLQLRASRSARDFDGADGAREEVAP